MTPEQLLSIKHVLLRAFTVAKNSRKDMSNQLHKDFVIYDTFQTFLSYVYRYLELWAAFLNLDTDCSKVVSMEEFVKAAPIMESWGIDMSDPVHQFQLANKDCSSSGLSFEEFCDWAIL